MTGTCASLCVQILYSTRRRWSSCFLPCDGQREAPLSLSPLRLSRKIVGPLGGPGQEIRSYLILRRAVIIGPESFPCCLTDRIVCLLFACCHMLVGLHRAGAS
jgi:hypothetical protein